MSLGTLKNAAHTLSTHGPCHGYRTEFPHAGLEFLAPLVVRETRRSGLEGRRGQANGPRKTSWPTAESFVADEPAENFRPSN
jgi:hypothetical protein